MGAGDSPLTYGARGTVLPHTQGCIRGCGLDPGLFSSPPSGRHIDGEDYSYLRASTGSIWAARVAGTVPKMTPTAMAEERAMTTDQGEMGRS